MDISESNRDWRSPLFRRKVVAQIEEAMRKAGTANTTHRSGTDMENHVYIKAKTREEYLSLVSRLIIHFRDIYKKSLGCPDPMNALTKLTGVDGSPGTIGMGPRPTGATVCGMGAMGPMQIGQHAMAGVTGNPQFMKEEERRDDLVFHQKSHKDIEKAMEVPDSNSYWRSPLFRQKVVAQIEETMRKAGPVNTTHKSGTEMEDYVYMKAKTREEYLSLVARLIIHFRDIHKKALGGPAEGPGQISVQQQQMSVQQQQMSVQQQQMSVQQQQTMQFQQLEQQLKALQLEQQQAQNHQLKNHNADPDDEKMAF